MSRHKGSKRNRHSNRKNSHKRKGSKLNSCNSSQKRKRHRHRGSTPRYKGSESRCGGSADLIHE